MTRDDYEAALDALDARLRIEFGSVLRSTFTTSYVVRLSECDTPPRIMKCAEEFFYTLLDDSAVPSDYLIRRFVRLAKDFHKLKYDFEPFCRSLDVRRVRMSGGPEYVNIPGDLSRSACLKFTGRCGPYLHIEREFGGDFVKLTQPLSGYPNSTLHAFVESMNLVVADNYMLFTISPPPRWVSSYSGKVDPSVDRLLHETRFLIQSDTFNGDTERILSALNFLFRGLNLTVNHRQPTEPSMAPGFSVEYVSPSVVRRGRYDFCLQYLEPGLCLTFSGVETGHESGGMLDFPTPDKWDTQFPLLKGQRERVKSNIVAYARESRHLGFIKEFLLDEERVAGAAKHFEAMRSAASEAMWAEMKALRQSIDARIGRTKERSGSEMYLNGFLYIVVRGIAYAMVIAVVTAVLIAVFSAPA